MSTAEALLIPAVVALTDEEIIHRVVAGETPLFEILVRRYNQRVYRAVRAILRNDEAEDVMQQAYINAYEHLRQFEERARFSTWLTRIAVNEAFARVRSRDRRFTVVQEEETMENVESTAPDPEQQAVASQLREIVEREVSALPESYRVVLVLREVEGLSTAETAECLSVTDDVVKTRLHRARTMLRDNLNRRAGLTLEKLFPFGNSRCDRVVAAVMEQISGR